MTYISTTLNQDQKAREMAQHLRFANDIASTTKEFISEVANPINCLPNSANRILNNIGFALYLSWDNKNLLFSKSSNAGIVQFTKALTAKLVAYFEGTPSAQRIIENW